MTFMSRYLNALAVRHSEHLHNCSKSLGIQGFLLRPPYLIIAISLRLRAKKGFVSSICYSKCGIVSPGWKQVACHQHLLLLNLTSYLFLPSGLWKNIELKVEGESLKRELQEKDQLLGKAS